MSNPLNIISDLFKHGRSRGAFHGKLHCPYCSKHVDPHTTPIGFESDKPRIRLSEYIGPYMREYRCLDCGSKFRYDIRGENRHPYDSFKRGLNKNIKLPGLNYRGRVPLIK